nr:hypothetical protein BCU62_20825 [Enterovibrio norvegicus]
MEFSFHFISFHFIAEQSRAEQSRAEQSACGWLKALSLPECHLLEMGIFHQHVYGVNLRENHFRSLTITAKHQAFISVFVVCRIFCYAFNYIARFERDLNGVVE